MGRTKNVLKVSSNEELLSYIINSDPMLSAEIDLPKQGESIKPIGKLIVDNERYKNAFINAINVIGLTIIKRNRWDNPWDFTIRGTLSRGQSVREMITDLVKANDYNENLSDVTAFLKNVVPNVLEYIHNINFQKYYETTTSDEQLAMAFETEEGLLDFIEECIAMLNESYVYDRYIIDKYMLCRRILDGTMCPTYIANWGSLTPRQRVAKMKDVSNKMTFRTPNYNPAGLRKATSFDDQIAIVSTDFDADITTEVLATSFFRDDADMKIREKLIDGFGNHDTARLSETLGDQYVAFTDAELSALAGIPAVIISREFFMDYIYSLDASGEPKKTEFYNPASLRNNHFLHAWLVFSTSPFENATVFTTTQPSITSVTVTPATATLERGAKLQYSATVVTAGFANEGVYWTCEGDAKIDANTGVLTVDSDATISGSITVTATSVYNTSVTGTATVTVGGTEETTTEETTTEETTTE